MATFRKIWRGGGGVGWKEGRKEMKIREVGKRAAEEKEEGVLKPDTQELRPAAFCTEPSPAQGGPPSSTSHTFGP